jgi:hypothetical protein
MPFKDYTGQRFGRLLVLHRSSKSEPKNVFWTCQCNCGAVKDIRAGSFATTKSCGCWRRERASSPEWGGRRIKSGSAFRRVLRQYKHDAKRRGLAWELTDGQAKILMTRNCYYTGRAPAKKMISDSGEVFLYNGIDRLNNLMGYVWENCVSCCHEVNMMKHIMATRDFLDFCKEVTFYRWSFDNNTSKEELCRPI